MLGSRELRGNQEQPAVAEANAQRPQFILRWFAGSQTMNWLLLLQREPGSIQEGGGPG
jgi:hypothetical protein